MSLVSFQVESEELDDGIHAITIRGELDMNTAPGIALIVRAWQQLDGDGNGGNGRLVLCCVNHQVRRLLKITGVESSISMHDQRDAALAELRG